MIIKFKIYESFYNDFYKEKNPDIDYYLKEIESGKYSNYEIKQLFHWACIKNMGELAIKISEKISNKDLRSMVKSIVNLDTNYFEKLIDKENIYEAFINERDSLEYTIGRGNLGNLKILEDRGLKLTQRMLELSCYHNKPKIVEYLLSKDGNLDPRKKKESPFTHAKENCLDIAASSNKNADTIRILIKKENIPVTYRHMLNAIRNENFDGLELMIKSHNIIRDYSYSNYATHDENKIPIGLMSVIISLISKDNMKYIKMLVNKNVQSMYDGLMDLPTKKIYTQKNSFGNDDVFGSSEEVLTTKSLKIAYYVINKYEGVENILITRKITYNTEDFWISKMKKDPKIIDKLQGISEKFKSKYNYQKVLLETDKKYIKQIINSGVIHPKILKEYDYLDEIIELTINKYNL